MHFFGHSKPENLNSGIQCDVSTYSTTTGEVYGLYLRMKGGGSADRKALHILNTSEGSGERRGLFAETQQAGDNLARGIDNQTKLYAGTYLDNPRHGTGIHNYILLNGNSTGHKSGIYNIIQAKGTGKRTGIITSTYAHQNNTSEIIGIDAVASKSLGNTGKVRGINIAAGNWGTPVAGSYTYGIYCNTSADTDETIGIYSVAYGPSSKKAAWFQGDVVITGSTTNTSDINLKENIIDIEQGIEELLALRPVEYNFIEDHDDKKRLGFIAQELEQVMPSLTEELKRPGDAIYAADGQTIIGYHPSTDVLGVKYIELIPLLTKAIQEQQAEIELLKQRITDLEE